MTRGGQGIAALGMAFMPSPVRAVWHLLRSVFQHGPTLYALAAWTAARHPERPALHDGTVALSFHDLLRATQGCAAHLASLGVGRTVRKVGLLSENHAGMVTALLACPRLGADVLLLNTSLSTRELAVLCQRERVDLLLCDPASAQRQPDLSRHLGMPLAQFPDVGTSAPTGRLPPRRRAGRLLLLTSGTTGTPKVLRQGRPWRAVRSGLAVLAGLGVRHGERVDLTLPLYHGHGLSTFALSVALGASLSVRPRFDARDTWSRVNGGHVDVLVLVPTILHRLLQAAPEGTVRPPALRAIISGSGPLSEELADETLTRFGPVLHNLYGTSEAGILTLATPLGLLAAPHSVGHALPGIDLAVRPLPGDPQGVGAVWVRGGLTGTRWANTGDLGRLDGGQLTLHGRQDDLLICGGENVYPDVLERRIAGMAPVEECAVCGCPDAEYGQAVALFVVLSPGATAAQVMDALQGLPRRFRPKVITAVPHLPRTPLGKLQRHALRSSMTTACDDV